MRVLLLAAGEGKRMLPLTANYPKGLLKVGDLSLIEHHLQRLAAAGLCDIVINVARHAKVLEQHLGDGRAYGLRITYSREPKPLETAGGIRYALALLGPDPFIVINSDVWTDYPFAQLPSKTERRLHLVMVNNPPQHPKGDFYFHNKTLSLSPPGTRLTFSGIGVYSPACFQNLSKGQAYRLRPIFEQAIQSNQLTAEHYQGDWQDIGTPERLAALRLEANT